MNKLWSELKRRNVVRVGIAYVAVAWVIMQFVDVIQEPFNLPEWFQRVSTIGLAILLPIVLLFSWAFEVTPEGVKKTSEVDESESVSHGTGQKINKITMAALVVAIGFIAYQNFFSSPAEPVQEAAATEASIAVLPFADLSADGSQEYFGDGIAEELLNVLARMEGIKVAGRTSSFQFKGEKPDLRMVGETLGVAHVLEGSVRTDGNMLRITAQLISAHDGFHVWSETYDREMTSIFAIQDEIAGNIATKLLGTLGAEQVDSISDGSTHNAEAYDLYLQAKFVRANRSEETLKQAEGFLLRAVELDPNYANAWGALAKVYSLMFDQNHISAEEGTRKTKDAANKALALHAENSEALASLALAGRLHEFDIPTALTYLDRAIKSNPNDVEARHWQNLLLMVLGDMEGALQRTRDTWQRDQYYTLTLNSYLRALVHHGLGDEGREVLAGYREGQMGEEFELSRINYLQLFSYIEGDEETAFKYMEMYEARTGISFYWTRYIYSGSEEDKAANFTEMLRLYKAGEADDGAMTALYIYFGDYDSALPYARKFYESQTQRFLHHLVVSAHPAIHPRYRKYEYNNSWVPLLEYMPEVVELYKNAGVDIYEVFQAERPNSD